MVWPEIEHVSPVRGRRLTARAMARPLVGRQLADPRVAEGCKADSEASGSRVRSPQGTHKLAVF